MMALADDVARLREVATALAGRDVTAIEGPDAAAAHRQIRAACDLVLAFAARLLARVQDDGRWAASSARTFPEWVARSGGDSVGAARNEAALGTALGSDLPATSQAVAAGEITLEHAQVLTRYGPTSDARREALRSGSPDRNEAALVDKARQMGADDFRRAMKQWAIAVDEASAEREHAAALAKEHLTLNRRPDGVTLSGFLTAENADVLSTALHAVTGVPTQGDARSTDERRAAALTDLARLVLDRGLTGSGASLVRPHISVHVNWETYQRLAAAAGAGPRPPIPDAAGATGTATAPAELDDGEPIPPSVLARIACDSAVTRIVFGPDGRPLDVGRAQRTYTGPQRHAVIARDRHCQYPGCDAPPLRCEVHHIRWWSQGGPTSVPNGILVCWYHHDVIHQRNLAIASAAGGVWEFRRPDGSLVRAGPVPASVRPPGERPGGQTVDRPPAGRSPVGEQPVLLAV